MAKGIEKGTIERKDKGQEQGITYHKTATIAEISLALLADGTPTAKVAFLTGMTETEIKRLIECI
jgi:hypothetical protein